MQITQTKKAPDRVPLTSILSLPPGVIDLLDPDGEVSGVPDVPLLCFTQRTRGPFTRGSDVARAQGTPLVIRTRTRGQLLASLTLLLSVSPSLGTSSSHS